MTKTQLIRLFDYQRFEKDPRLQKVIDGVHRRMDERELTDDEIDSVAAAGVLQGPEKSRKNDLPGGPPV